MFEVRVLRGRELFDAGLVERVVEFDRRNMRHVWARAGMKYPEANPPRCGFHNSNNTRERLTNATEAA